MPGDQGGRAAQRAGADADRARRFRGQGARFPRRRRRLSHQTVRPARTGAALRSAGPARAAAPGSGNPGRVADAAGARAVRAGGRCAGFTLLLALCEASPRAVSRSALLHALWGAQPPDSDALKSHVYALRKALEKAGAADLIATIPQLGYRLQAQLQAPPEADV
ncbi:helix-turn-helix domain-containing protein [Herbaspirillum sp. SJZ107]|uniref:winged helix-turn-helix domain-containing protein n=1 Tax=Herbaspirillum sp. SJZ107 TaxID=2572881 RepID=UPI002106AC2C|nr:helix-turn-helix domain-containing protein [Herbaspirillum sp. SJZ107]